MGKVKIIGRAWEEFKPITNGKWQGLYQNIFGGITSEPKKLIDFMKLPFTSREELEGTVGKRFISKTPPRGFYKVTGITEYKEVPNKVFVEMTLICQPFQLISTKRRTRIINGGKVPTLYADKLAYGRDENCDHRDCPYHNNRIDCPPSIEAMLAVERDPIPYHFLEKLPKASIYFLIPNMS